MVSLTVLHTRIFLYLLGVRIFWQDDLTVHFKIFTDPHKSGLFWAWQFQSPFKNFADPPKSGFAIDTGPVGQNENEETPAKQPKKITT